MSEYTTLPTDALRVWPGNPRKTIAPAQLDELAASIRARGVDQPITVRPLPVPEGEITHEILAGQRRWLASQRAGLGVIPVRVRCLPDDEALELALAENSARTDVSPIEEAESIEALLAAGRRADQVADRLGRDLRWVEGRRRLLSLVPAWRERVAAGTCPLRHAELLARLEPSVQEAVTARFAGVELPPFLSFETAVRAQLQTLRHAPFAAALEDETYPGGSCAACPKRSDKQANLFVKEPEDDAACLDTACWTVKVEHLWKVAQKDAKKRRLAVITNPASAGINPYTGAPEMGSAFVSHYRGIAAGAPVAAITRIPSGKIVELYDREAVERAEAAQRAASTRPAKSEDRAAQNGATAEERTRREDERQRARELEDLKRARALMAILDDLDVLRVAVERCLDGTYMERSLKRALSLPEDQPLSAARMSPYQIGVLFVADAMLMQLGDERLDELIAKHTPSDEAPAVSTVSADEMVERYRTEIAAARSDRDLGAAWEAIVSEDHQASLPALTKLWLEKASDLGLSAATLKKMRKAGHAPAEQEAA